jgi:hypothetical protein
MTVPVLGKEAVNWRVLHAGLHWDFMWQFMVVSITHPLTGIDLLSHFSLLVDCQDNCLLDRVM